jgi:dUTP pyrophosphatase
MINLKLKKVHKDAIIPRYQTDGSACADLHCVFEGPWNFSYVHPGQTEVIQTGLVFDIPEGYELQVRARSGMSAKGVILANGVGTIDSDYKKEVKVILHNCSPDVVKITQGDRIAQCMLSPVTKIEFEEVDYVPKNGRGGLGSTGNR